MLRLLFLCMCLGVGAVSASGQVIINGEEEHEPLPRLNQPDAGNSDAYALNNPDRRFSAALLAGFNAAQIDGDAMAGYNHFGINAGIRGNVILNKHWATSIDILYSQKGSHYAAYDVARTLNQINVNYAEIPVMVHFSDWRFRIGVGLSYAQLLYLQVLDTNDTDITSSYTANKNDANALAEVAFFITPKLALAVLYEQSFFNIFPTAYSNGYHLGVRALYQF